MNCVPRLTGVAREDMLGHGICQQYTASTPGCTAPTTTAMQPGNGSHKTMHNHRMHTHHHGIGCCSSPALRATAVPTSQYVEIGSCELATSRRLSSPLGPLQGSISASNTTPPLPQLGLPPTPGMASSAAGVSLLSTRAIGASLSRALSLMGSKACFHSVQQVPVHVPLVEAKRCPASSSV